MNKNYLFLTLLMLLLAVGTLFIHKDETFANQLKPEELLREITQPSRYVTTDQIAKMIIEKDPTLELIDVRPADEYNKFSLPDAVNVPLKDILTPEGQENLGIEDMYAVFYSNDDIMADQAWVISKRLGYNNIYVLKGGLNRWVETIIRPVEPPETASETEFELYQFRKAAGVYFTGGTQINDTGVKKTKVKVRRKKKAKTASGGC
jgi:rhodanese-related sulfurtransferase